MFGIGMTELMVIFVIGLLVLGPKRLPSLARSLGRSLAEFRRASSDLRREFLDVSEETRFDPNDIGRDRTPGAPGNEDADSTPGPTPAQAGAARAGGSGRAGEQGGAGRAGTAAGAAGAKAVAKPASRAEPEPGHEDAGVEPGGAAAPTAESDDEAAAGRKREPAGG